MLDEAKAERLKNDPRKLTEHRSSTFDFPMVSLILGSNQISLFGKMTQLKCGSFDCFTSMSSVTVILNVVNFGVQRSLIADPNCISKFFSFV